MNIPITEFASSENKLTWIYDGKHIEITTFSKISNSIILTTVFGIAVIATGAENEEEAYIFNPDGSLRCKIENPYSEESRLGPYYFIYEVNELVLVFAGGYSRDWAHKVNEADGTLTSSHETR